MDQDEIKELLKSNLAELRAGYEQEAVSLTPEERPYFDKILQLMEELSESTSPRCRAIDTALTLALSIPALHPIVLSDMVMRATILILRTIVKNHQVKSDPRFNQ